MQKILAIILFLLPCWVFSANDKHLNVVASNQQFRVMLPANPTTGFEWSVTAYDKSALKLVGKQFIPPTKMTRMGAGGVMSFTFSRLSTKKSLQSTTITFSYARPWEMKPGISKKVIVDFNSE